MQELLLVKKRLGVKIDKVARRKKPMWKRRLQKKIKKLMKDLNQLAKRRLIIFYLWMN